MKNRLKEIRQEKKLSQKDLAKKLNISQQAISLYEKGDREPKLETWQKLADFFDVSVPYLRGATTYEILDPLEKGIYSHGTEAMDRAFNDYALSPLQREMIIEYEELTE